MSRFGSWFRSGGGKASSDASPAGSSVDFGAKVMVDIEDSMAAAGLIMNDDIDGAEEGLRKGDSAFHQLGLGVTAFMRSLLGFEKEVMLEASTRLANCEATAWADAKRAQKEGNYGGSKIYPPGTEYSLIHAEAQLMSAVVGVLQENFTEGIKGFYKLRKAFLTLDSIMEAESKMLNQGKAGNAVTRPTAKEEKMPGGFDDDDEFAETVTGRDEDSDLEFVDAKEAFRSGTQTPLNPTATQGKGTLPDPPTSDLANLQLDSTPAASGEKTDVSELPNGRTQLSPEEQADSDVFANPLDGFIHSGANMCFGVLLLIISMVPPGFSQLLYFIGFKGDRERGIRMLWRSTKFENINGAVAGLVLLSYYNGLLGFSDIQPPDEDFDEDAEALGYPTEKCSKLLASMRSRYPDSQMWRMEESRVKAHNRQLRQAIPLLTTGEDSKMRQVAALNSFELSLNAMFVQDWNLMRDSFLRCVELNDWSHAMYYFLVGCAELELYRDAFHAAHRDEAEIRLRKKKAEDFLHKAPTVAGRKRFMARQLPFEVFALRKIQKWEARAKEMKIDLADAAGVSPAQEMVYLWNGTKRMDSEELNKVILGLDWGRCTAPAAVVEQMKKTPDEAAIRTVCMSAALRRLLRFDEPRKMLENEVLNQDRAAFKGPTKDDYTMPAAHYEMAVLAWFEACHPALREEKSKESPSDVDNGRSETQGVDEYRRKKVDECQEWLDKVAAWESFTLDARFGMRVQTGLETLQWFRKKMGWI